MFQRVSRDYLTQECKLFSRVTVASAHLRDKARRRNAPHYLDAFLSASCGSQDPDPLTELDKARVLRPSWKKAVDEHGLPYYVPLYTPKLEKEWNDIVSVMMARSQNELERSVQAVWSLTTALRHYLPFEITTAQQASFVWDLYPWFYSDKGEAAFKQSLCAWSAFLLGDLQPDVFSPVEFYPGIVRRRFKRMLLKNPVHRKKIAQAFLMGKKAAAQVSESFEEAALLKCRTRLTDTLPPPEPHWFKEQIRRTVREVVFHSRMKWDGSRDKEFLVPSERAHFSSRKCDGGALSYLLQWREAGLKPGTHNWDEDPSTLLSRLHHATLGRLALPLLEMREKNQLVAEVRGYSSEYINETLEQSFADCGTSIDTSNAAAVAVLEALKVRVITKGNERLQYIGRYLQKFLHRMLSRHECFQIDGVITTDTIQRSVAKFKTLLGKILSGDYIAATDNIAKWATDECWSALSDTIGWGLEVEEFGYKILTEHTIHVDLPGDDEKPLPPAAQTNGQLMGGVTSFILLCLINACANRYAMELSYGRRFSLAETGMLINGDDCLLSLPDDRSYRLWQIITSQVGLEMSKGKNYFLPDTAVINSRMYHIGEMDWLTGLYVHEIPFVNPGHLAGVGRVLGAEESDDSGFLARCVTLLSNAGFGPYSPVRDELIREWTYLNAEKLKRISAPGQSWYLPRWAGGLGVPRPSSVSIDDCSVTSRQICRFLCNFDLQAIEYSTALTNPDRPDYVSVGLREMALVSEQLGEKAILVPENSDDYLQKDAIAQKFSSFCLWPQTRYPSGPRFFKKCIKGTVCEQFYTPSGQLKKDIGSSFRRVSKAARHTTPCKDFPFWERCVMRPAIEQRPVRFNWDNFWDARHRVDSRLYGQ